MRCRTHHLTLSSCPEHPLSLRAERQTATMIRRAALFAGLLLMLPVLAAADPGVRPQGERPGGSAPVALHEGVVVVEASCASLCRQRHNQCRISTRGAPSCDADLQRCLKGCLATKRQ